AHKLQLCLKTQLDHLVDSAFRDKDGNFRLRTGGKAQAVDAVQALQEPASHEVAVDVDRVVADLVQADALAQGSRVGEQHHAVGILAEPPDLFVPVSRAAVDDGWGVRGEELGQGGDVAYEGGP